MRLIEFVSEDEWERLARIIYDCTWQALNTYQQHHANGYKSVRQLMAKPSAKLKPQAIKSAKALARKAKQPPHAVAPKPLPKPNLLPQAKAEATPAYRPVKTAKPLPPTTRMAVAKVQPATNKPAPQSITDPNVVDQAARRMLPANKRGQNPVDLVTP